MNNFQNIIDLLRRKKSPQIYHKIYGYINQPCYNNRIAFRNGSSNLYNEFGERLEEFFFRDTIWANTPYRMSRYFTWDRYNFGLKTHFYTQNSMLETVGYPEKKYGCLVESEGITPHDYELFKKHKGLQKDFDLIFTHSEKILNEVENARFVPFCASLFGSKYAPANQHKFKKKKISICYSHKTNTQLNKYRLELAKLCEKEKLADTYGTFNGGPFVLIDTTLKDYRYTFCIENIERPLFFTEKIICAFANQTIPIYLGASKIDKFFNPDGIIKITTKTNIPKLVKQLTEEEYQNRLPAIMENYEKAKNYINPWDYMYKNYFK